MTSWTTSPSPVDRPSWTGSPPRGDGWKRSGLLELIEHPERLPAETQRRLGLEYFKPQIPCPFLEDESCSIYAERPFVCREYLVTSPAENCTTLNEGTIEGVADAVADLADHRADRWEHDRKEPFPWVPLISPRTGPRLTPTRRPRPVPRSGPAVLSTSSPRNPIRGPSAGPDGLPSEPGVSRPSLSEDP